MQILTPPAITPRTFTYFVRDPKLVTQILEFAGFRFEGENSETKTRLLTNRLLGTHTEIEIAGLGSRRESDCVRQALETSDVGAVQQYFRSRVGVLQGVIIGDIQVGDPHRGTHFVVQTVDRGLYLVISEVAR